MRVLLLALFLGVCCGAQVLANDTPGRQDGNDLVYSDQPLEEESTDVFHYGEMLPIAPFDETSLPEDYQPPADNGPVPRPPTPTPLTNASADP